MCSKDLANRLLPASLTVLAAVVLFGLTPTSGSHAQTPSTPTSTATRTATAVLLAQQQVAATPTFVGPPNLAATATWVSILTQQYVSTATPMPTITPVLPVTPASTAVTTLASASAPSGATAADACAMQLASVGGGQTIDFEQISLTLPGNGSFSYGFIRPDTGANPQLVVCDTQTRSTIYVDGRTGQETARRLGNEAGVTNLNQIRAAARSRTASSSSVTPPNTGDGGLR
jgi:hypothetical protein